MEKIEPQETLGLLKDMNGNNLRQGDLVMVLLEKPVLVGFVSEIKEPSILTSRDKNPPGVLTVTGTIKIPFAPNVLQILRQTAKLVDPRSEALVDAITRHVDENNADIKLPKREEPTVENPAGPTLVPSTPTIVPNDPTSVAD